MHPCEVWARQQWGGADGSRRLDNAAAFHPQKPTQCSVLCTPNYTPGCNCLATPAAQRVSRQQLCGILCVCFKQHVCSISLLSSQAAAPPDQPPFSHCCSRQSATAAVVVVAPATPLRPSVIALHSPTQ